MLMPLFSGWTYQNEPINMIISKTESIDLVDISGTGALYAFALQLSVPTNVNVFGGTLYIYLDGQLFLEFPMVQNGFANAGPFWTYVNSSNTVLYVYYAPPQPNPFRQSLRLTFNTPTIPSGSSMTIVGNVSYVEIDPTQLSQSIGSALSNILSNFRCS